MNNAKSEDAQPTNVPVVPPVRNVDQVISEQLGNLVFQNTILVVRAETAEAQVVALQIELAAAQAKGSPFTKKP